MKTLAILTTLVLALCMLGCPPREHLRKDYGKAFHARFKKQQIHLEPTEEKTMGLDSEEAAAIHAKYRKSLADNKSSNNKQQPQILLLETKGKK